MKKYLLVTLLAAPLSAFASDNTITFQGEVTDETCAVTVNGNDASPIVLLPTVAASELNTSGSVAGQTTFEVGVSGCTASATGINISTVFIGNQVTSDGNLGNTGTAENVDIQILDTDGLPINFTSNFNGSDDLSLAADETSKSAEYTAQYYSTGAATAGTVQATLQYAVSYQ